MKRYLIHLLMLMMTTGISVANAGPSQKCIHILNVTLQDLEGISLEEALKDGRKWSKFKEDAKATGKWIGIVETCCPPCSSANKNEKKRCKECQCGYKNDCTWKCKCCWLGNKKC